MRIWINQQDFSRALGVAQKAANPRASLPVLGSVLLWAPEAGQQKYLTLEATDLETRIQAGVLAEIEEAGSLCLPARDLADLVRFLPPAEPLSLASCPDAPHAAVLSRGSSRWRLNGYPAEEFPKPQELGGRTFSLPADCFKSAVRKGGAAVAKDAAGFGANRVFAGIYLQAGEDGALHVVSTDTHRLAHARAKVLTPGGEPWDALIPGRNLLEAVRLIDAPQCTFHLGDNACALSTDDLRIELRLLEGRFPDWRQVISRRYSTRLKISAKELIASIQRALVIGTPDQRNRVPVVRLGLSDQSVLVESSWQERGEQHEELAAEIEGESLEIAFNARYFLEGLQAVDAEEVTIEFSGPAGPAVIRPEGEQPGEAAEDDKISCMYLVLPVRLT